MDAIIGKRGGQKGSKRPRTVAAVFMMCAHRVLGWSCHAVQLAPLLLALRLRICNDLARLHSLQSVRGTWPVVCNGAPEGEQGWPTDRSLLHTAMS